MMASLYTSKRHFYMAGAFSLLMAYPLFKKGIYPKYNRKVDAHEKTVILTGATGTLGTATAHDLAKRKCRLIMACRNMAKCKELRRELVLLTGNHSITCKRLNLEDIESINDFADNIIKEEPNVDVLINNAAVKYIPHKELTKYGIEKHFWVNFLAPYLLTFRLLDKLKESAKASKDSRVVNIIGHPNKKWILDPEDINFNTREYSNKRAYQQSKLALAHFTILLNRFYQDVDVRAFGVSPPEIGSISPILDHTDSMLGHFKRLFSNWYSVPAYCACGTSVLCAVDDLILNQDGGGGLYSYFIKSWGRYKGWGILAKNDLDAKTVWNLGANILLQVSTSQAKDSEHRSNDIRTISDGYKNKS